MVPTGRLILNVAQRTLKRHAVGDVWETQIGSSASSRLGFYGTTPVVQPSGVHTLRGALVSMGIVKGSA